jgi:hypothetical protein
MHLDHIRKLLGQLIVLALQTRLKAAFQQPKQSWLPHLKSPHALREHPPAFEQVALKPNQDKSHYK